jgi:hypothetical protein
MDSIPSNAEPLMNSTLRGISIDSSDEYEKAEVSIPINREFGSNEITESDGQQKKHNDSRISTFRGMLIERSDENEKADDSIRINCEGDSNDSDQSVLHCSKHFAQSMIIDLGIHVRISSDLFGFIIKTVSTEPMLTILGRLERSLALVFLAWFDVS